jgi:hypothetical protein
MNPSYPPYTPAPTPATVGGQPLSPVLLSTQEQANAMLQALLALSGFPQTAITDAWGTVNDAAGGSSLAMNGDPESRGFYEIMLPGGISYNVGQLLAQEYAQGVGAPGNWSYSATVGPAWTSTIPGPTLPSAPVIPPAAPPPPNTVMAGGIIPVGPGGGVGTFTQLQVQQIMATNARVAAFLTAMGY